MSDKHDILTEADFAWLHERLSSVAEHRDKCTKAIASIGGDPATVAELVAALREINNATDACLEQLDAEELGGTLAEIRAAARAVLAKLPENSNEPA